MDFEKRLERAIERGHQTREQRGREQARQEMTEEDLRNLHSTCRLELSDHIESCLRKLADHFPGFRYSTVVGEKGWGAKLHRDDFGAREGGPGNYYSRLEMVVAPFSAAHILELKSKGTVRNKEVYDRRHFQLLSQADVDSFKELIDLWVLEYAEAFATQDS